MSEKKELFNLLNLEIPNSIMLEKIILSNENSIIKEFKSIESLKKYFKRNISKLTKSKSIKVEYCAYEFPDFEFNQKSSV
ncbi:MAG: hypothetical protein ACK4IZ_03160 [Flavobacterium sp.]|uniref:hypothetical protein n=1 Tax=Flavobacterium sp. TaxID=239 RepID=UPI00391D3404